MVKKKYKTVDKIFTYIIDRLHDKDQTCLNMARQIYGCSVSMVNMDDEQIRVDNLKDSPHVLKDEVYMKLEETLDALEHLCSEDDNMECWNDGIGIIDSYMYEINYRVMKQEMYESLRKTSVDGIIAEIITNRMKINTQPC
ncbi:MAG: hypothetical protein V1645_01760 [archaeon]